MAKRFIPINSPQGKEITRLMQSKSFGKGLLSEGMKPATPVDFSPLTNLLPVGGAVGGGLLGGPGGAIAGTEGGEILRQLLNRKFEPVSLITEPLTTAAGEGALKIAGKGIQLAAKTPAGKFIGKGLTKAKDLVSSGVSKILRSTANFPEEATKRALSRTKQVFSNEAAQKDAMLKVAKEFQAQLPQLKKAEQALYAKLTNEFPELKFVRIDVQPLRKELASVLRKEIGGGETVSGKIKQVGKDPFVKEILSIQKVFSSAAPKQGRQIIKIGSLGEPIKGQSVPGKQGGLKFEQADELMQRINRILTLPKTGDVPQISSRLEGILKKIKSDLIGRIDEQVPGFADRSMAYREFRSTYDFLQRILKNPETAEATITNFARKELGGIRGSKQAFRAEKLSRLSRELTEKAKDIAARNLIETASPSNLSGIGPIGLLGGSALLGRPELLAALPFFSRTAVKGGMRGLAAGSDISRKNIPRILSQVGVRRLTEK